MTFGPANTISSYLPIEFQVPEGEREFRELVTQRERQTASIVNVKENGNYDTQELLTAQQWFSVTPGGQQKQMRYTFRKIIDFGAIDSGAGAYPRTKTVAHGLTGINNSWIFTKIQAVARQPATPFWIPIPWYNGTDAATVFVGPVNVSIVVTTAAFVGYTQCYVILEYIKG